MHSQLRLLTVAVVETRVSDALAAAVLVEPAVTRCSDRAARLAALRQRHARRHVGHGTVHRVRARVDVDAVVT